MKNKIKILITSLIVTLSSSLQAVELINKDEWLNIMSTALPAGFCHSESMFRQCFRVTAQECKETATSITKICLNRSENKIPLVLQQPKDGKHWGGIVGACAGRAYVLELRSKRIRNAMCNNPANWK